ncbi:MAG: mevalonate kinase [Candidatus Caldarchaeum sp.]|nr:mevalonate kinase [Candidatus Caldarchaeum sp.]MCS7133897.1 mevalonate kinase [Candidatus Caldarchaeum sp.]MDW8435180.1 mevalonate kinase [Candidatus Caldarchaeum sp.]
MKESATASAPGKVILFGEHFVVSGFPAIVTAIDKRVKIRLTNSVENRFVIVSGQVCSAWSLNGQPVGAKHSPFQALYDMVNAVCRDHGIKCVGRAEIDSEIMGAAGLGSSAAVAVALVKAFSDLHGLELTIDKIIQYAMKAETEFHGRPSGIDPTIAAVGGTIIYHGPGKYMHLATPANPKVLIVFSGKKRKTSKMVNHVQQLARDKPRLFGELTKIYSIIYREAFSAIQKYDVEKIGKLFTMNHLLMRALGLSNESVEKIIEVLAGLGVYGSKLTGAGGGGCVIAVAGENIERIAGEMSKIYPHVWLSQTGCRGVGE